MKLLKRKLPVKKPAPAPVKKGQQVGVVTVTAPGMAAVEIPLVAGGDVDRLGFFGRVGKGIHRILFGANG